MQRTLTMPSTAEHNDLEQAKYQNSGRSARPLKSTYLLKQVMTALLISSMSLSSVRG